MLMIKSMYVFSDGKTIGAAIILDEEKTNAVKQLEKKEGRKVLNQV